MTRKYDVWFCGCGRIHVIPTDVNDWMSEDADHRSVIQVCKHCGATYERWLDPFEDPDFGPSFYSCGQDVEDGELDMTNRQYRMFFGRGIQVPLKAGGYAEAHQANTYINWDLLKKLGISSVYDAERTNRDAITVDTERLIREVKDDDILQAISSYVVGIDWSGTKYDWSNRAKEET